MRPWTDRTDEELVSLAREGSGAAFGELVDRYAPVVYRVARVITGVPEDAEEVVQETFLRAFKHLEQFSIEKASFRTWLLAIARNQSINVFSALKRKAARFLYEFEAESSRRKQPDNPHAVDFRDAESLLSTKQEYARLQKVLAELPERQRTALILKTQEELSYEEIARIMNSSSSAVESLIFRARRRVIELLER
ncbi:MAG: sigma-70 family RNA polymerase sigma factor [Desulfomonile tiedjei]|nr:sigma-70 family RNA polymerase sigma factor [Desulfomonile tiedjei]